MPFLPAEPLLAAQVLSDADLDGLLEDVLCGNSGDKRRAGKLGLLGTGCRSVDDALGGGIEAGRVVSVSAEVGDGDGGEFCRALLAASLFKHPTSTAAVIDTTGNFDIVRLYALILAHLQRTRDDLAATGKQKELEQGQKKAEDVAAEMLNRVKIMRAFDFVGVREAIAEVRDELEGRHVVAQDMEILDPPVQDPAPSPPAVDEPPKRTFVADSEDEDSDQDEEMLFETTTSASPSPSPRPPCPPNLAQTAQTQPPPPQPNTTTPKFILLDTLAHVLTPLMKKDSIPEHALASTFLTSLTHLTRTHNLYTVLLNPLLPPRTHGLQPPPPPPALLASAAPQQQHKQYALAPSPSLFASSTAVPALGAVLPRYVDVGVLVERVPRGKADAKVFYREEVGGGGGGKGKRGVKMGVVVEVVGEREGGRGGGWGVWEGM
ncbi:hypothetical protein IQ07DRAFT_641298 [Pyrenochaeta sp. DS3sAY3a]|nr:hypothetical protein IQ07DRAFT_641298 [Pyrenochaeta sp. DS3sAY3a]